MGVTLSARSLICKCIQWSVINTTEIPGENALKSCVQLQVYPVIYLWYRTGDLCRTWRGLEDKRIMVSVVCYSCYGMSEEISVLQKHCQLSRTNNFSAFMPLDVPHDSATSRLYVRTRQLIYVSQFQKTLGNCSSSWQYIMYNLLTAGTNVFIYVN